MKRMNLIVGLGNPEGKYDNTYHNVGFATIGEIAKCLGVTFAKKGNQMTAKYQNTILLMPLTYMNLSGQAVVAVARKYKIEPADIIVICDDLYINKGNIRISIGGSGGGHNGLKSVTELLGTNQYVRVRVGIAPTEPPQSMAHYVLSKIDAESQTAIEPAIESARQAVTELINGGKFETVQGKYNVKNK